jgi:hypothetical protein
MKFPIRRHITTMREPEVTGQPYRSNKTLQFVLIMLRCFEFGLNDHFIPTAFEQFTVSIQKSCRIRREKTLEIKPTDLKLQCLNT